MIYAGDRVEDVEVREGFGVRIMTGAVNPKGCEAIVSHWRC